MYNIKDKAAAIREVQRFLLVISQENDYLNHITVDGIYGEETKAAIYSFQSRNNIPATGITNKETFDMLYRKYTEYIKLKESEYQVFDKNKFPLKRGSSGNDVSTLNTMLRELSLYYKDLSSTYGDYFSAETEESVKLMQKYFLMDENGEVNIKTFNRIKEETEARKNFL